MFLQLPVSLLQTFLAKWDTDSHCFGADGWSKSSGPSSPLCHLSGKSEVLTHTTLLALSGVVLSAHCLAPLSPRWGGAWVEVCLTPLCCCGKRWRDGSPLGPLTSGEGEAECQLSLLAPLHSASLMQVRWRVSSPVGLRQGRRGEAQLYVALPCQVSLLLSWGGASAHPLTPLMSSCGGSGSIRLPPASRQVWNPSPLTLPSLNPCLCLGFRNIVALLSEMSCFYSPSSL